MLKVKMGYRPGDLSPTVMALHLEKHPRDIMTKRMHELRAMRRRSQLKERAMKEIREGLLDREP